MANNKVKIIALCKQVAEEFPQWQVVGGKFVNKVNKEAHYVIDPRWSFKTGVSGFSIKLAVKLPKIMKLVNHISHLNHTTGHKMSASIYDSAIFIDLETLVKSCAFIDISSDVSLITPDDLIIKEIRRWLTSSEKYLYDTWPVEDLQVLFELMQQEPKSYRGLYGPSLCCLAAYLGKFDFIDDYYAGKLPHRSPETENSETDENLLAILPDWQAQWQATDKIKV